MTTRATPASSTARDLVGGAETAGDLELERGDPSEGDEQVVLARFAGSGAVEIDEMRFLGALRGEVGERGGGIVGIAGFAREIALRQANAAAGDEVDGGEQNHAARNAFRKCGAGGRGAFGMELRAPQRALADGGGDAGRAVGCAGGGGGRYRRRRSHARNRHSRRL